MTITRPISDHDGKFDLSECMENLQLLSICIPNAKEGPTRSVPGGKNEIERGMRWKGDPQTLRELANCGLLKNILQRDVGGFRYGQVDSGEDSS
jgi:hypothetical protein